MRWGAVMSVCVVVLAGCGSGDEGGTGPRGLDPGESIATPTAVAADAGDLALPEISELAITDSSRFSSVMFERR